MPRGPKHNKGNLLENPKGKKGYYCRSLGEAEYGGNSGSGAMWSDSGHVQGFKLVSFAPALGLGHEQMWECADCCRWACDWWCINWGRSEGFCSFSGRGPGPGNREGRRGSWFFSLLFLRPSWPGSAHRVPIPVSQCERQWAEQSCGLYSWKSVFFFSFQSMWLDESLKPRPWVKRWHFYPGSFLRQRVIFVRFPPGFFCQFLLRHDLNLALFKPVSHCHLPLFQRDFFFQGFLVFLKIFSRAMCCSNHGGRKRKLASEVTAWLGHSKREPRFSGHLDCSLCYALNEKRANDFAKSCNFFFF